MSTPTSDMRTLKRQGQCKTALGLLEAAAMLINRASTEAPAAGINGQCVTITKHIEALQRTILEAHDRETR